jgi:hypothetical protein
MMRMVVVVHGPLVMMMIEMTKKMAVIVIMVRGRGEDRRSWKNLQ